MNFESAKPGKLRLDLDKIGKFENCQQSVVWTGDGSLSPAETVGMNYSSSTAASSAAAGAATTGSPWSP